MPLKTSSGSRRAVFAGIFLLAVFFLFPRIAASTEERPYFTDRGQFNYGRFLAEEGDYRTSAMEFERLIEAFPGSPLAHEAQFRLSGAYFNSGLFSKAEENYRLFLLNFRWSTLRAEAEAMASEAHERSKTERLPKVVLARSDSDAAIPSLEPSSVAAIRAVQVMFFEGRNYDDISSEMRRLKEAGVDTVIIRAFHNRGDRFHRVAHSERDSGVYFSTALSPVVGDVLPEFAAIAHKNGLKVFAWMTSRYADYGVEDSDDLSCKGYEIAIKAYTRCKGLDIFNENAVRRLEAIYSDLAATGVDGILFQDDLVLRHNEGFGPYAAALFKKDTGLAASPDELYVAGEGGNVHYTPLFWKWATWKNGRLLAVAKRLKHAAEKKKPGLKFALNLMYESVTNPPYALAWLSQSLPEAVKAGFDYYSIMAYHRQMGAELEMSQSEVRGLITKMTEEASKTAGDPRRILIKLQTIDWKTGTPLPDEEVAGLIRDIKSGPVKGLSMAVVPYRQGFPFHELSLGSGFSAQRAYALQ
ncbi:MAG: hypothetical protein HZB83_00625 [Deltaproteobacteria bacterium]|nr:hypothetical protein [Deltaproteobacteria bacterium]